MPDTPDNLLAQLSRRVQCFLSATGISQRKLAKLIKTDETHLANFLAGRSGLSAEKSLRLMQILNASRSQLEAKLVKAATMQITHFQERGKPMRFSNDGWVAGVGPDPNDGDITAIKTARDLDNPDDYQGRIVAFLKDQQSIYRQAIVHIDNYLAGIKAKPNPSGITGPARSVPSNTTSRTPGSRGDFL